MRLSQFSGCLLAIFGLLGPLCAGKDSTQSFDVAVYGGTAGGVMAAIAAAQSGVRVVLLEPGGHIGGMVSGGLSNSDVDHQQELIGGLTRQFFERVGEHYQRPVAWSFEPHVAEQTFDDMLERANVKVFLHARLLGISKAASDIQTIQVENADLVSASVFIDSGYEGDLMKAAGVSYVVGREGRSKYNETLAGRQELLPGRHQFASPVSADVLKKQEQPGLVPYVVPEEQVVPTGEADGHFQSYCYRLCLTDQRSNWLPIERPASYAAKRYELARRYLESAGAAVGLKDFLGIVRIPNGKADVNSTGPLSTDLLGASWKYPEASYAVRQQIAQEHMSWAQGLLYFLQNEACVPAALRTEAHSWGLPKDEFADTDHWPHQLYVREGRRMLGEYVLTQHDLQENREKYDSVGMAGYNIDIREVQWLAHKVFYYPNVIDQVFTEGYLSMPVDPWQIPYRALLPKQEQCGNLLVTATISASTIAYGSFRMEANYMIAGESAGRAAALAIRTNRRVHQIDVYALQRELLQHKQIISLSQVQASGKNKS